MLGPICGLLRFVFWLLHGPYGLLDRWSYSEKDESSIRAEQRAHVDPERNLETVQANLLSVFGKLPYPCAEIRGSKKAYHGYMDQYQLGPVISELVRLGDDNEMGEAFWRALRDAAIDFSASHESLPEIEQHLHRATEQDESNV